MILKNIYFKLIGVFELHVYIECILRVDADLHESINLIKLINSFRLMSPQQECAIAKLATIPGASDSNKVTSPRQIITSQ